LQERVPSAAIVDADTAADVERKAARGHRVNRCWRRETAGPVPSPQTKRTGIVGVRVLPRCELP